MHEGDREQVMGWTRATHRAGFPLTHTRRTAGNRRRPRAVVAVAQVLAFLLGSIPTLVAPTPALAAPGDVCYMVADNGSPHTTGADLLTRFDDTTGVETIVDSSTNGTGTSLIEAIVYDPLTGVLYATDAGTWGTLNLTTGDFSAIGATGYSDIDSLALDPFTGVFYGAVRLGAADDVLVEIDPATGAASNPVTILSTAGVGLGDIDDFAIDTDDATLYAIANNGGSGDRVVIINRITGAVTDVGPTAPAADVEGLGYNPYGQLMGTSGSGAQLWDFNETTGAASNPRNLNYGDYESIDCNTGGSNAISGTVFNDLDSSGGQGSGELGIPGVTVNLYRDTNGNGSIDAGEPRVGTVTTDGNGHYAFAVRTTGAFVLDIDTGTLPAGAVMTTDNLEAADFGTAFGQSDTGNDFGAVVPPAMSVTKTSDLAGPVGPGDVITYTITATNTSTETQTDIVISDPLPTGTTYVSQSTVATGYESTAGSSTVTYDNIADVAITSNSCFNRTFSVSEDLTLTDVDLGFNADHTYRGDIRLRLTSPDATTVTLVNTSNDSRDGYDLKFDDASTNPINDGTNDSTASPYYDRTARPQSLLGAFNGESSAGTWTLEVCDLVSGDVGTYHRSQLVLSGTTSGISAVTRDNVPGGANPDLVDGVPADLVEAADGFLLTQGSSMTVTFQVQVDNPLGGGITEIENTVAVTSDQQTTPVTASDLLPVGYAPALEVVKSGPATADVGDTVTYTFSVTNDNVTGDGSPITITGVTDDVAGAASFTGGDDGDNLLEVGETWTYQATHTVGLGDPDPLDNTVTVTGTDQDGDPVPDATDTHSLDIDYGPALAVAKSGPATANVGDTVTYTFSVANDNVAGDGSPITVTSVTDDNAGAASFTGGDDGDNLLEVGETWTYEATHTVGLGDSDPLVNTVTVTGTDQDGDPVADATDTHSLDIDYAPEIDVVKSGPATADVGDTVTYTFSVTNDNVAGDGSPMTVTGVTDDVAGAASYTGGDDGDNLLEVGETWTYQATHTVGLGDPDPLDNTVTVSGTDADGDPVADATDTHSLDIDYEPVLDVTKAGPATADVGDTVTYTFQVFHDGTSDGSPVANVLVTDDIAGTATYVSGDNGNGLLEGTEIWFFSATHTITLTDPDPLSNTVTVAGDDRDGDPITPPTDGHSLDIDYAPALDVVKSGPATADVGDTVTYTFSVTNDNVTGDGSPITITGVTDDVAGAASFTGGDDGDNLLEVGETWTYQATHTVGLGDPDPLDNTVTVTGTDQDGDPVPDATDTHSLDIDYGPALAVAKSGPATANVGDTVTYTFSVANDNVAGDGSPITVTSVTDDNAGAASFTGGDDGDNLLEVGETWTYEATHTVGLGDSDPLVNTVTVTGTDQDGDPVADATDTHSLDIDYAPEIDVVKSGPATADVGDTVTYTFSVTNDNVAGDGSPMTVTGVTDDVAGAASYTGGDDGDNLLEVGETWTYQATHTVGLGDPDPLDNTVTVSGTDADGDPVADATDTHSLDIDYEPVLDVTKAGPATANLGDTLTYTFSVTNDNAAGDGSPITVTGVTDDVAGAASYTGGDDGDNLLEVGETWTYQASHTVTLSDPDPLLNTVTVSGTDQDGDPVPDATDTHSLDIDYAPEIDVVKSGPVTADVGDTVTYTFAVTNDNVTGDGSPITITGVTDDIAGAATYQSGDDGDNLLEVGETWTYQASHTVTLSDPDPLLNTVTVTGTDQDGDPVPDATDTHSLDLDYGPALAVAKSGPATANVGDTVTYTFAVTNDNVAGDGSPITITGVTDDIAGAASYTGGDDGDNLLEVGETWTYTVSYTIQPIDPDPLANTVTVTGTDQDGGTVTATDGHSLDVEFVPAMGVVKSGPASASVGDTVTFTFTVTNDNVTGDGSPITITGVTDDIAGAATYQSGDDGDNLLEVGETWTYQATHTTTLTDPDPLVNTVTVTGTDADGDAVTPATDTHSLDIDYDPEIDVVKSGSATANVGDTVTYSFAVTNENVIGDGSPISVTSVTDDIAGAATYVSGDDGDNLLEVGETWTYQATHTVGLGDADPLVNTVTVTGTDQDGDPVTPVTDSHSTDVDFNPQLNITKGGPANANVGDTLTFTFLVFHDGTSDGSPVYSVSVTDDVAGSATYVSGDDGDGILQASEIWAYSVTYTVQPTDSDPLINTATVTGTDADGDPITPATDTHSTNLDYAPAMSVAKSGPATANLGDTVAYTFSVTNDNVTGDGSPITVTGVTDDIAGAATYQSGDDGDNLLEVGETWTYQASHTITLSDPDPLINTVTVTGTDQDGDLVANATDSHTLDIGFTPAIDVVKSGPAGASVGDTVTYTFSVTNDNATGDGSPIAIGSVTDDIAGAASFTGGDDGDNLLEVGETWTYQATHTIHPSDPDPLVNTVTVTGTDQDGDPVADASDGHSTGIDYAPALDVVKSGPATANVGDTVTYSFEVTNDNAAGDGSPITVASVTDDIAGAATYQSGDDGDNLLEVGETWTYQATHTITLSDPDPLINTVTVTGTDQDGDPVPDATDTHSTALDYGPGLDVVKSGPATANVGSTVTYTFAVTNDGVVGDGSPITVTSVTDDVAGAGTYLAGDDGDNLLEVGETWTYQATHTVGLGDPDPLVNTVTVTGNRPGRRPRPRRHRHPLHRRRFRAGPRCDQVRAGFGGDRRHRDVHLLGHQRKRDRRRLTHHHHLGHRRHRRSSHLPIRR